MSRVAAVCRNGSHTFSKVVVDAVTLLAGLGVDGDAHAGTTVQHLSRMRRDPTTPNLRQVHLVHAELLAELSAEGFGVGPGAMGENVTTSGVDLLGLPTGAVLRLGPDAVVRLTGLRNPCVQLDSLGPGLMKRLVHRGPDGGTVRLAGVMAVVEVGGVVRAGDAIEVRLPDGEQQPLEPV
ncbi:MAG TPA: MOSC domain-containing protein [Angustibacter sp.]|nr:MOSC domain-containing protein [Angustibacter sp.]